MSPDNDKPIDCVEMKRRAQEEILQETAGMSPEQELEYWRLKTEDLRREQERLRQERRAG